MQQVLHDMWFSTMMTLLKLLKHRTRYEFESLSVLSHRQFSMKWTKADSANCKMTDNQTYSIIYKNMYCIIDTWIINKNWTHLFINKLYRFSWQKTLAHWYLKSIDWNIAIMESKNWKIFKWKIDDIVNKNPKNTSFKKQ